jgi:hypothetical protein
MNRKAIYAVLLAAALLLGAATATASAKKDYWYRGKTSQGEKAELKIGYAAGYKQTWVSYMSFGFSDCSGAGAWAVNGGVKVSPSHSFGDRHVDRRAGGYLDIKIIHGRVSGWDAKRKAWKKATGTWRIVHNEPAYVDDYGDVHPAVHCDNTYKWTATRRG